MRTQNFAFEVFTDGTVKIQNNHTEDFTITDRNELQDIYRIIRKIINEENGKMKNEILINELAQRIIDIDFYGARDADETPETIAETIKNDPLGVIQWLVELLEEQF